MKRGFTTPSTPGKNQIFPTGQGKIIMVTVEWGPSGENNIPNLF